METTVRPHILRQPTSPALAVLIAHGTAITYHVTTQQSGNERAVDIITQALAPDQLHQDAHRATQTIEPGRTMRAHGPTGLKD
eukprot:12886029-Prorocentrum_lima.AAC.1